MKLKTDLAGTPLKTYQTKITLRETTNFAAAVGDNNPKYFADDSEEGIVSHPMFPVSVTWPVLSRLEQFIESGCFPKEVLMTQVHYTEHLILHRLIRPGDALSLRGTLTAFLPHRAGTHAVICLNAEDEEKKPVFTEYIGAMLRGVDCGEGGTSAQIPLIPENENGAKTLWTSTIHYPPFHNFYVSFSNRFFLFTVMDFKK